MNFDGLNAPNPKDRIEFIKKLKEDMDSGKIEKPKSGNDVNNHIHTIYSFSPYSPAKAVWCAYMAGLSTAGIMDHDSISGAREFIKAAEIMGMASTIGAECRVDMSKTPLAGRRINNPDQESVAYVALHGIPHTQIDTVTEFFKPVKAARTVRNRMMTDNINKILAPYDLSIDFDKDVVTLSEYENSGSVTERHLLFAVSKKLIQKFGQGSRLTDFLVNDMKLNISEKVKTYLNDENNPFYEYDLLGALKSEMVTMFLVPSTDECPDVREIVKLAKKTGSILAYAYLGDVGNSVTGDKKTQKFEDDYIAELFDVLKELGFDAVTYMPSRNTMEQLERIRRLCEKYELFQISGEDINTPRQSFICEAQRRPEFANLEAATWALIGHEKAATIDISDGMFSKKTAEKYPSLNERIEYYSKIGRGIK